MLKEKMAKLLSVKSIVTIVLTVVFAYLAVTGVISGEQFLTVFTVIIAFYFGTQHERKATSTATETASVAEGAAAAGTSADAAETKEV